MMQWLVNDFKALKAEVMDEIKKLKETPNLEERVSKLEGEIRALKARMGKKE